MIQLNHVSKTYHHGHQALRDVTLHLGRGELAFLTGHSGAGKSTLLKLIALIERPTQGQMFVNGQNVSRLDKSKVPYYRRQMGIIFQDHKLLFDRTVYDNVALPLVIAGCRYQDIGKRVRAALDMVGLIKKEQNYPIHLSGGEQQRVGIARAVVNKPPLLLADEPTGNLDPNLSKEIMTSFERFNEVGVSVLIASHDLALISRLEHRIICLQDGQLAPDEPEPSNAFG